MKSNTTNDIINNANGSAQALFDFGYIGALIASLSAYGTSDTAYAASSAAVSFWTRPDVDGLKLWSLSPAIRVDNSDSDIYHRFTEHAHLQLDFSASAQDSGITKH